MNRENSTPDINTKRFHGKYRGKVKANADPNHLGRIQVEVPDVLGKNVATWATPCVPMAGARAGCFVVPPSESDVWVEFEQGDPDYPIWTGGFWLKAGDVPDAATNPAAISNGQNIVIQTTGQNMVVVSDAPPTAVSGGIVLKSAGGATIVVNDAGIFIDNGKGATITLIGPAVTVNKDGLTVI